MIFYRRLQDQKLASRFFGALQIKMQTAQNRIKCDILSGASAKTRMGLWIDRVNVLHHSLFLLAFSTSISRRSSALVTPNPSTNRTNSSPHAQLSARSSTEMLAPGQKLIMPRKLIQNGNQQEGREFPKETLEEDILAKECCLPVEVAIVEPILRFLQLLCENHNSKLQVNG